MAGIPLYIAQRLLLAVPLLIGATLAAFALGVMAPGDPALHMLEQQGVRNPAPEQLAAMRTALGLDRPLADQYIGWLGRFVRGDLGTSLVTGKPVAAELARTAPATLMLAGLALAVALVSGVGAGLLAGHAKDRWPDHVIRVAAQLLLSMPGFWLAILLIALFAEQLRWLPTSGWTSWRHAILPGIVLGAGTAAVMSRMTRTYAIATLAQPFVLAARGRGLPSGLIAGDFVLRPMLAPLLALAGTYLTGIVSGTVIVETIFAIPGAGRYAYEAVLRRDYVAIQGYVALVSLLYIAIGILTDIAACLADPRIALDRRA